MLPKLGTQKNGRGGNGTKEMYIIFIRNATFCLLWGSPNNSKAISLGIGKIIKSLSGNSEAGSQPLVLNLFLYAELKESLCACPFSLWPEFQKIDAELNAYLQEVTDRVVKKVLHEDSSDATVVDRPLQLEMDTDQNSASKRK